MKNVKYLFSIFFIVFLLTGCQKESYKISENIKDVTTLKINNTEYLADILEYEKNNPDDENILFDIEDSYYFADYDLSNTTIHFLNSNKEMVFKDYIKQKKPTLIIKISSYCEHCKNMPSKEIFDSLENSDFNILFWCEEVGLEDQLEYIKELGINPDYAVILKLNEEIFDLNDLGYPTAIFLNYENKVKIIFQTIKPSAKFVNTLLNKITSDK